MEFEGLVVLALDLEFGLEFFDEKFEARDFGFEFLDVGGAGLRAIGSGYVEIVGRRIGIGTGVLLGLRRGRNVRKGVRLWRESVRESARPGGFGARVRVRDWQGCWRGRRSEEVVERVRA